MKVYILDTDPDRSRGIYFAKPRGLHVFASRFNGQSMKRWWRGTERFRFVPSALPKVDAPYFDPSIPVFTPRAARVLDDLLVGAGELLPIKCQGYDYHLFNVTKLVDALDEDNCAVHRFKSGRIMYIKEYSFFEKKLAGVRVFKLTQEPLGRVYVTDPFVERVKFHGLTGFVFPLIWRSD